MASGAQAIALLQSWVDQPNFIENPARSNCCQVTRDYGPIGGIKCYAWCAATIWDIMRLIGTPWPKTAQVLDLTNRAKRGEHGMVWLPKSADLRVGDVLPWDWNGQGRAGDMHVSMCKNPSIQSRMQTLGGNENDRVTDQWRDRTYLMGIIRPAYSQQEESDLTTDEHNELVRIGQAVDALAKHIHENVDPFIRGESWWAQGLSVGEVKQKLGSGGGGASPDYEGTITLTPKD